jgi:hypothetical protein
MPRIPKIRESPEATKKRIMAITTALVSWVIKQVGSPIHPNNPVMFTLSLSIVERALAFKAKALSSTKYFPG